MKKRTEVNHQLRGAPLLAADEQIIAVERPSRMLALPRYLATLGLYEMWRKRQLSAVADRRLLLGRGVIRHDEKAIPLRRVQTCLHAARRRFLCECRRSRSPGIRDSKDRSSRPGGRGDSRPRSSAIFLEKLGKDARRFAIATRRDLSLVPPTRRFLWPYPEPPIV